MALPWLLVAACAELGAPAGSSPATDAGPDVDGAPLVDESPVRDAAPPVGVVASCAERLALAPASADGVYSIDRGDGVGPIDVYCDMGAGGVTYEELAFGDSFATYDGYSGATGGDLAQPAVQQAFIYLLNRQGGGATNIAVGYNSMNCCFKGAGAAASTVLAFGGSILFPAETATDTNNCNGTYSAAAYRFMFPSGDPGIYPPSPMPANYFELNPPSEIVNCSDSDNPGFFFRRSGP
jgi:hypothetical protein